MLPKQYHPYDEKWIEKQLQKLPPFALRKAIEGYEKVFAESYDGEPIEYRKMNVARYSANTRLRKYIEKIIII